MKDPEAAKARLLKLIDRYWDLAYAEGAEKRDHDTAAGDANRTRGEICELIEQLAGRAG